MIDLLHDPFIQSSALPLLLGLLATGALRLLGGPRLAAAGIALSFLAVFALVVGIPALSPPSSMVKLFWSAAAGLALGLAADSAGIKGKTAAIAVALWLLASLAWIVWPAMTSPFAAATALLPAVLALWVAFGRLPNRRENPTLPGAVLLALSFAIGGTALIGSSASLAQIALALAAATGGFLLWNWPVERHVWGVSGQIALGITVLIAAVFTFFTSARAEILLLALLPALAAIGAAYVLSGGDSSPY